MPTGRRPCLSLSNQHRIFSSRPAPGPCELVADSDRDDLFFAAVERTRMPMVVTDPRRTDNPIIFANQAFSEMSGYPIDGIVGRNCRFLQGPETDRAAVAAIRDAIHRGGEISTEILNYRKDGTTFWNALFVSPVLDRHGQVIYFFATQFDVSRRRNAEEWLAQAQKMEALGKLTGGISHDFNNLLQVMLGHVDLLARRLSADPIDVRSISLSGQKIRGAIDKASTLTRQLLAFARKQRLEGRLVNLNDLAANMTDAAATTLGVGIRLVTDFGPQPFDCHIDVAQFEGALLNLLGNARDAIHASGTVTIRTFNVAVGADEQRAFGGLEAGRYAAISVTDTGPGIPSEIVHRVTEPFFTTKDEGKGTGMGLSMVHGFAKQSGGGIQIESKPGHGTTVRLYFPAAPAQTGTAEPVPAAATGSREPGGKEVILVVDDRPEVLDVATNLFEELDYRVLSACSGLEALRLVDALDSSDRPALLFSDVIMPGGMNGYVLARKLREGNPKIRVLLTTGFAGDVQGASPRAGSEFEVIEKPYRLEELARRVRRVLDTPARIG